MVTVFIVRPPQPSGLNRLYTWHIDLERKAGFEPANSGVLKPAPNAGAFTY